MKKTALILISALSFNAYAVSWKVYGPCDEKPVAQGEAVADLTESVGDISVEIFDQNKVPYIGAAEGFNSIINTPTGMDSIEVVSDTELRAYGWCYSINGKTPDEMPHKIKFNAQTDKLIWFYAYTTNIKNEWQDDYCSPAYWIKAKQFCGK